jgi:hypothetical protein
MFIFLDEFAKLQKVTISFFMSVHLSVFDVRQHGTTRLPLEGFSENFIIEYFSKICRQI